MLRSTCLLILFAACRPSATVEQTTPIANLQSYSTVAVRVSSSAFAAHGRAMYLEAAVLNALRQKCAFTNFTRAGSEPTDVLIDLNLTHVGRGGGFMSNSSQATVEAFLVLSDGHNGDLLGTSKIRGKSSGIIVNNNQPENQAMDVMAQTIAETFVKSGCAGPRVARAEPPPPDTGTGTGDPATGDPATGDPTTTPPDENKRAEAEAINDQAKDTLRSGDMQGALAGFRKANDVYPDARYVFNMCLALEALEQWQNALAECQRARGMKPDERLLGKIDHRIQLLAARK